MGTSSGANFHQQSPPKMLPPRHNHPHHHHQQQLHQSNHLPVVGLRPSLSLLPSDSAGQATADALDPASNSDQGHDSQTESASSRETWPVEGNEITIVKKVEKEGENEYSEQPVVRRLPSAEKLTLREVAREKVEAVAERMEMMPDELLEELKSELRGILEGNGGSQNREEFLLLQKFVQTRTDLSSKTLSRAHRSQLEILVAINTGIQAFLHPNISLPSSQLIEVFVYKRCRNIACQNTLPADECSCEVCSTKSGFCNLCMCVVCYKFDFEVNTCRWIGCDLCSHWTHTDCAIRDGKIGMGPSSKSIVPTSEMLFRCQACNRTSELLGWVKDVFQHCAPGWDRDALARELDYVSRIFRGSEDPRGRKLFWKCEDLIEKMKSGFPESSACKLMLMLFQDLEMDSVKIPDGDEAGRLIAPQEACNRIAKVVQEALRKMEMVAEEKMRMTKRARQALESCDRELEDKTRELAELKLERQRKKQQVEELESIVRLKQAESEMFQIKAMEARREAERLQSIALAKSEKAEQDYASRYLKARLEEAEMEKQYLFEKIKLQESQRALPVHSGSAAGSHEVLKNAYAPPKSEGQQPGDHYRLTSMP